MATIVSERTAVRRPVSSARRDLLVALASVWLAGGLFMDGWAHSHVPSLETFFTPWHGVLYSGYAALAISLVPARLWRGRPEGAVPTWVPAGYGLGLLGAILFAAGGVIDMTWHITFGIETDLAALLSPPHLLLLTAGSLMIATPIRAAAAKLGLRTVAGNAGVGAEGPSARKAGVVTEGPSARNANVAAEGPSARNASVAAEVLSERSADTVTEVRNPRNVAPRGNTLAEVRNLRAVAGSAGAVGGGAAIGWRVAADVPVLISATSGTAVAAFFLDYLSPFTDAPAANSGYGNGQPFGLAQYLAYSVLVIAALLFVWSRLGRVPFGLVTLVVAAASIPNGVFDDFENLASQLWPLLGAVMADLALQAVAVRWAGMVSLAIGVVVPLLVWPAHLVGVQLSLGVAWSLELWSGVVVLTMLAGAVLGGLFLPLVNADRARSD